MAVSAARKAALLALSEVEAGVAANVALRRRLGALALHERDRALATELVYGVTRWRLRLDAIIDYASRSGKHKPRGDVRHVLRLAAYELFHLHGIPHHATCHQAVALARWRQPRAAGFVNALCRRMQQLTAAPLDDVWPDAKNDPAGHLAMRFSHPVWLVERWLPRFGFDETRALLEANNEPPPLTVRVNRLRTNRDALLRQWQEAGLEAALTRLSPDGLTVHGGGDVQRWPGFSEGLFSVQDESSQLVAQVVAPKPGERILDMCSAPGGKTTHLAERMDDDGEIVALDVDEERLRLVKENARRLGLNAISPRVLDAAALPQAGLGMFHRVLLDAPCTSLGVLRRVVEARWQKRPGDVAKLAALQSRLLDAGAGAVRPGGVLVYSVCTTEPEETVDHIGPFLARHEDFHLDDVFAFLPEAAAAGRPPGDKAVTLLPHVHGTDGFFIARFRRAFPGE